MKIYENTRSYQKCTVVIRNGSQQGDSTEEPPLKRLRRTKDVKPLKEDTDKSEDEDEYGNLKDFIVYDHPPKDQGVPLDDPMTTADGQSTESTYDQDYADYVKNLPLDEQIRLRQIERELSSYCQENTKPLKYQILSSLSPMETKMVMMDKLHKLELYDKSSTEYTYELSTLNLMLKVPWGKYQQLPITTDDKPDVIEKYLSEAMTFLEGVTYGQHKAKQKLMLEISRYLKNPDSSGFILGIKGPPGSGKTTLASLGLARILNRPFTRIDLGGAKHSDILFGTRKVFDRSDIGGLIKVLIEKHCMNPIIFFDELDKVSVSEYGQELLNALNDLTDPMRNSSICDQYLDMSFDYSRAIIVFAYNYSDQIPETLKSRIHEIEIEPYSVDDKIAMVHRFFLNSSCRKIKVDPSQINITDGAIKVIIDKYTDHEEGVRELARRIDELVLKIHWLKLTQETKNHTLMDCYSGKMGAIKLKNPCVVTQQLIHLLLEGDK
jgi:ATP-dependent Lon protease